jgi:CRP-like cAMP-binding protein
MPDIQIPTTHTTPAPFTARRPGNLLLASLPAADFARIAPSIRTVSLKSRQLLHKQDAVVHDVCFLARGACSIVKVLEDGYSAEVATIGREGAIGLGVFFGQQQAAADAIVHGPAGAVAELMPVAVFNAEMDRRGAFFDRVMRYYQALLNDVMQTTACNGLHSAEQRCCRWLLTFSDRCGAQQFPVTHDFLAQMLGVRRPTMTLVLASLQRDGVISHSRGHVEILDRAKLEQTSCECYATMNDGFRRLLPELAM